MYSYRGPNCIFTPKHARSTDGLFRDVKFAFPYSGMNTFHSELAISSDNVPIAASNSYLDDFNVQYERGYDEKHTVLSRINKTYAHLKESQPQEYINETVCSFMTPFDSVNFGHNLSIAIDFIHQYRTQNLSCPIVITKVSEVYPNILRLLRLFFDDIRILENDKVYHFSSIYFFEPVIFDILRHPTIIQEMVTKVIGKVSDIDRYKNKKVFLVKLANHNKNMVTQSTSFYADTLLHKLEATQEWIVINPEKMSIYDIIVYLQFANTVVTSYGAINYGHALFFSKSASVHFLFHKHDDVSSYGYYDTERMTRVYCKWNLDENIEFLNSIFHFEEK